MSITQRLVSPQLPTALTAHPRVELPGYDIWLHNIDNVHVLPTELDVPKFEGALSKALQLYPHAAGQLRCSDERWYIELTDTPVPVDIDYRLDTSSDSLLDGDWVVQDDISPFLNHQPVDAQLVNGGAPLLRLKLTYFDNETCIGVSWHHTLGDAMVLLRFMHTLSQFYQGLSPKYPAPTFKKHYFPTPSCSTVYEFWPRMPHLHDTRSFTELIELFTESCKSDQHLRWRFNIDDLAELRLALSEQEETYLSKQDCLTAYLVSILNYNRGTPVQTVGNTSCYRNMSASFVDENVVGNLLLNASTTVPADLAGIATTLRHALVQSREPDYICNWMSVASKCMLETANAGKSYPFTLRDNMVNVNSNTVIDWCSAHFGCPDGSRFHTFGASRYYLRCFRSNPVKGDYSVRGSVDISMGIPADLKPRLLETLACGVRYVLNNEGAQL